MSNYFVVDPIKPNIATKKTGALPDLVLDQQLLKIISGGILSYF